MGSVLPILFGTGFNNFLGSSRINGSDKIFAVWPLKICVRVKFV